MGVNSYFKLNIQSTGAFIELYPAVNDGMPLKFEIIDEYLTKRKITYDKKVISTCILFIYSYAYIYTNSLHKPGDRSHFMRISFY